MRHLLFSVLLFSVGISSHAQPSLKWSFDTHDAAFGQAAAADLDGDGKLEIVFGCYRNDSAIYVLNGEDGSLLWKYNAASPGYEGCNDVAPIIYDVDGDGMPEVIVPSSCNPKTFCFDGATGAVKWICNIRGSDSPPVIADVDGDGKPEILHGEFGGYVICINAENGTVAWEIAVDTDSWIQTAPSILDIHNDGRLDFIVATWNAVDKSANKIYAFRADDQQLLWSYPLNDVVYHGSAIGDLDHDGIPEIVIGSYNDTLYCLNSTDGSLKWKYSAGPYCYVGGPAQIADLNNDGNCDVVFTAWYKITALHGDGSPMWQSYFPGYDQSFRGAAVADVNNDPYPDLVFGTEDGRLIAYNGYDGSLIFETNVRALYGDSLFSLEHAPLIADFDQDGLLDVFIAGGYANYPNFSQDFGRAYVFSIGVGRGPAWLMFQHDPWRNSNVCNLSTGVEWLEGAAAVVTASPNPFSSYLDINLNLTAPAGVRYCITDLAGRVIAERQAGKLASGAQVLRWHAPQDLASGLYLCTVWIGTERHVLKIQAR